MRAGHCVPPHICSLRNSPLKCAHSPSYYSHTYLYITQTFIEHLLNVKNPGCMLGYKEQSHIHMITVV